MIEFKSWTKQYGRLKALDNISLEIKEGRVTAVLGPNGSGKTTLTKSILGLVKQSEGTLSINGENLNGDHEYRRFIGYMPQYANFPDNLKANEVLEMVKSVRNEKENLDYRLVVPFNLAIEMDRKVSNLSGGTRQKLSALIAFMFNPKIYIFDEPTAGLDPISSIILKEKILSEKEKGKTIILTTHILSEVEELADDIVFLYEGKIRFAGSVEELLNRGKNKNIESALAKLMEDLKE